MSYYETNSDKWNKDCHTLNSAIGNVIDEIEPKKGRAVIFSGDTYHASSTPIKNHNRVVLNFNYGI